MENLVPRYGFKGSILILGACMLHICLSAALYRPIEIHQAIVEYEWKVDKPTTQGLIPKIIVAVDEEKGLGFQPPPINEDAETASSLKTSSNKLSLHDLSRKSSMFHSVEDVSTDSTVYYKESCHQRAQNGDSLPSKSLSSKNHNESDKPSKGKCSTLHSIINCIDFSLIRNPLFLLLASTVMLMAVGCPQALFYLPSYANSQGLDKSECSLLLSISAVFDLTGRLGLGYIADLNLFSNYKAYSLR